MLLLSTIRSTGTIRATTFKGALNGNADTATKLATARTITLGNDLAGSVSFDGSGNVTIDNAMNYNCTVGGSNTSNYPWHRFAYRENITGTYHDADAIFDIRGRFNEGRFGRIKVSIRTNNSGTAVNVGARWLYRSANFNVDDIKIASWGTTGQSVYVDVFIKCGSYPRITVYQVEGGRLFTLINSAEAADTTASDPKTSYEVYKTVEDAGTALHNQAYTQIINAVDIGVVDSSNSSNKSNQLVEDTSYITSGTSFVVHTDKSIFKTYLSRRNNLGINIGSTTGGMMVLAGTWESGNYTSELALGMGDNYGIYYRGSNSSSEQAWQAVGRFTATPTSGQVVIADNTDGGIKSSGYTIATSVPSGAVFTDQYVSQSATTTSDYRKIVLSYQNGAAGAAVTSNTNVVYVTANAEVQPSTGNIRSAGTVSAANLSASGNVSGTTLGVISSSGTGGGISLYNGTGNVTTYGIAMRRTTDSGKHGYVQGDWGIYNYMSGGTTRGWVWRYGSTTNVASISSEGHAAFTGSVTIGANETNTSGVRQVYNSTTKSLDFVFVA